jgi:hypothetical protein
MSDAPDIAGPETGAANSGPIEHRTSDIGHRISDERPDSSQAPEPHPPSGSEPPSEE